MMQNTSVKGFTYGAIAAASYGLNPLFALPLYNVGISPESVLFYRYGLAVIMLGILMKIQKQSFALHRKEILPLLVMGLLMAFSSLTLFVSYNYMDAGIASTILFVYPVLVAIIMALFFKEKISVVTMLSIGLAFWGISLLYKGDGGQTLSLFGVTLVFISSLTYALYIIGVNRSILKTMPTSKLTFYALLFGITVFGVRLKFGLALDIITVPSLWINPVCMALFPTIISLITMAKAVHYVGSTPTAILGALEPITALVIGVSVFGEQLTPRIVTGIICVLIAVTLIIVGKPLGNIIRMQLSHLKHR